MSERLIQRTALILVILVYIAARLWGMTDSCLWFDEIFSIHAAELPWGSILSFVALDLIHPPLFYVLLNFWISVGGSDLLWLRTLPVVLSVIAVFPFIAFCRELKLARRTEILALFIFAINGSMIKYAQEVRMYSLLLCLSLFSMWLFARYFIKGKSFVPLVIVNVLLIYSHYFGWFFVFAEVAAIMAFQRIKWRRAAAMVAIALVSFLPWMVAVFNASRSGTGLSQNIGWMSRPGIQEVGTFLANLIEPFHFQASSAEPVSVLTVSIPLLLAAFAGIVLFAANISAVEDREKRNLRLILLFAITPVVIAFCASWLMPYSVWGTRHLIIVFAPFSILLAVIFTARPPSWLPTAAVTMIVLVAGYGFVVKAAREAPRYSWCAWDSLTTMPPDSAISPVYTVEDLVAYHVWFAGRKYAGPQQVVKVDGIDGVREDTAYFLPRGFDGVGTIDMADVSEPRLWLVFRGPSITEKEAPLRNFLVKGYSVAERADTVVGGEDLAVVLLEKAN